MTREEYINFANALKNNYTIDFEKLPEFCDMAISALSENKGEWIREDVHSSWKCSRCNTYAIEDFEHCEIRSPFCPNCGADMRGKA